MNRLLCRAYVGRMAVAAILVLLTFSMWGCDDRTLTMTPRPYPPKQGDMVEVRINATDKEHLVRVNYTIAGTSGTITSVPTTITVSTCKSATSYRLTLLLSGEAVYDDNEVVTCSRSYDLTVGQDDRENSTLTFDVYVARNGGRHEDVEVDMAARFKDRFDVYDLDNYYWAEEYFYTSVSHLYANGHDLTLSFGHGKPHKFCYDHWQKVDLSQTAYGNFVPCGMTGDAEYLAFCACDILDMNDIGTLTFWDYWFHTALTKHENRPFTGLHMVLGFRTNFSVTAYLWGYWRTKDGKDFVREFANKMDQGWRVRDAWLDAAGDELRQGGGDNMAAVLYYSLYGDDVAYFHRDDYIFPHLNAMNKIIAYLE